MTAPGMSRPLRAASNALAATIVIALLGGAAGCGSGGAKAPVAEAGDRELLAASSAAQQAFARGAYEPAAEQYRRALNRARLQDEPAQIGDQAYNLAVCEMALGKVEAAKDHLAEAEAALRRARLAVADILLVEARLAYRLTESHPDQRPAALAATARVLDDPQSHPSDVHRAQVALLRAEIACDARDAATAADEVARARTLAPTLPPPGVGAGLARAEARVHVLNGESPAAAEAFDLEAKLQRQGHRYADMSKALLHAAEAYAKANNHQAAADRFYRAALSFTAQEKTPQALAAIDAAGTAAAQAGDAPLGRLISALRAEVKHTAPASATATSP